MKIAKIITIATGSNAFSLHPWFHSNDDDYSLTTPTDEITLEPSEYPDDEIVGDWWTGAWDSLPCYITGCLTTTTGAYATEVTTTVAPTTKTELTLESSEYPADEIVGDWWTAAWDSLPCYITGC